MAVGEFNPQHFLVLFRSQSPNFFIKSISFEFLPVSAHLFKPSGFRHALQSAVACSPSAEPFVRVCVSGFWHPCLCSLPCFCLPSVTLICSWLNSHSCLTTTWFAFCDLFVWSFNKKRFSKCKYDVNVVLILIYVYVCVYIYNSSNVWTPSMFIYLLFVDCTLKLKKY